MVDLERLELEGVTTDEPPVLLCDEVARGVVPVLLRGVLEEL